MSIFTIRGIKAVDFEFENAISNNLGEFFETLYNILIK